MAEKLYSVKEIANILNEELEAQGSDYRYTEERVRSRLRYLRSKTTGESKSLHVTPRIIGYDRRAKYYTEEDVDKLRSFWIGPMTAEFSDYPEDLDILENSDSVEVEVREAQPSDAEALQLISTYLKTAKPRKGLFVAQIADGSIIGWAQGESVPSLSALTEQSTGIIRVWVAEEKKESIIAARSLILRLEWWLRSQKVERISVESSSRLKDLLSSIELLSLAPDPDLILLRKA